MADKQKLKRRSKKRPCVKNKAKHDDSIEVEVLDVNLIVGQSGMKAKSFHNPPLVWRLKIDLGRISSKNPLDRLVKPKQKLAKLVNKIISKVCELKNYD